MHRILYYRNSKGESSVEDYIRELARQSDKDSRIKLNKIRDYIKALGVYGAAVGPPVVKHVEGGIWELRPLRDRILFVAWQGGSYVLLHHFVKKTQKTPPREIEQAKREFADWKERSTDNDETVW